VLKDFLHAPAKCRFSVPPALRGTLHSCLFYASKQPPATLWHTWNLHPPTKPLVRSALHQTSAPIHTNVIWRLLLLSSFA
jgi:hypothetical protein